MEKVTEHDKKIGQYSTFVEENISRSQVDSYIKNLFNTGYIDFD